MHSQRTNYTHIDVAHVALAKVDANYIAVNYSCILPTFRSNMSQICHSITDM